jgi:hypothetical protein
MTGAGRAVRLDGGRDALAPCGVEHHWLQDVTTGVLEESPTSEDEGDEEGAYDPEAAFTSDLSGADLIAAYRDECRRSDEVLAVTPLSAAPRGLDFHHDPEYTRQITNVRWIVLHVIEETAVHSGHLEIARELLDGKPGSADADPPWQPAGARRRDDSRASLLRGRQGAAGPAVARMRESGACGTSSLAPARWAARSAGAWHWPGMKSSSPRAVRTWTRCVVTGSG